jgi:alkylation response protein AidB-like acyl-CoA dehydrogenase
MDLDGVLTAVHRHGPGWAERAEQADRDGMISAETASELRSTDVHRLVQPAQFGGAQLSIEAHTRALIAVAEYCTGAAWCATVWSAHNWMASLFPIEGQATWWADPTALISASIVPKNRFESAGKAVVVQGSFGFASGCDHADWLGVGGIVDGPDGGPVICLLPADSGIEIDQASWDVVGLSGSGSKTLIIGDPIEVPASQVLHTPLAMRQSAPGQLHHDVDLYRAPFRATAAIVLAAPAIGAAKAAVSRFVDRLDGHVIMSRAGSQRSDPAAAMRLAESSADVNAAELVVLDACARLDALGAESEPDPVDVASVHRDTGYGVRLAARAVDRLYEASGGSALQRSEPIARQWRDVNAARSHAVLTWDGSATAYTNAVLGA